MRRLWPAVALLTGLATATAAQTFNDAYDTYKRGDVASAIRQWQSLADKGDGQAQHVLGLAFQNGDGVARNLPQAFAWFTIATILGHEPSKTAAAKLVARLSKEQEAEGTQIAIVWFKAHPHLAANLKKSTVSLVLPERIPDWEGQVELFRFIHNSKEEYRQGLMEWIELHQLELTPAFLFKLSAWKLETDPKAALDWFVVAFLRGQYDGQRCEDKTAQQELMLVAGGVAGNVQAYARDRRNELGEAGLRVLNRPGLFAATVSPLWICIHGMSSYTSKGRTGVVPNGEWPAIEQNIRDSNLENFRTMAGQTPEGAAR